MDKRLQMKTCTKCRESKPLDEFTIIKAEKMVNLKFAKIAISHYVKRGILKR